MRYRAATAKERFLPRAAGVALPKAEALLVMKFGGTSVGSAERMKVACDLIAAEAARRPVVAVVSAMSKITDLLLDATRHAEAGDQAGLDYDLHQLEQRHFTAADALIPASKHGTSRVREQIGEIVAEFQRIVSGIQMLGHVPHARSMRRFPRVSGFP